MSARDYALAQLDQTPLPGWQRNLLRRRVPLPTDLRDIGLAEQIRVGAIKNHALLEFLCDHYARRAKSIDPLVRKIVVLGLYQLRFLTRVPAPAVVDEAVEQARRFGRTHAAGFVNAVLRAAARQPEVPLPTPQENPERYATIVLSHPIDLVRRLIELFGSERALEFCQHNNAEPPTLIRLFQGVRPEQLLSGDIQISSHEQPGMFVAESARRAVLGDWATRGLAQVQDATAAAVVEHLDVQPGQQVLDRCSGMGTKTLQIRDHLGESGWIMAVDPSKPRSAALRTLLGARAISNVAVVQASMLHQVPELKPPAFDRILVDAPCSNSGVLARRPEARYTQTPQALASLLKVQDQILNDSADQLRPGGLLVYSTCSIWPEENEQRIRQFLDARQDYEQVSARSTWPSSDPRPAYYHDGGYFAVLRRR